jgi:RimJ/RimL family protein N-acetyltransferase
LEIHPNQFVSVRWTSFNSKAIAIDKVRQLKQHLPAGFTVKRIDATIANRLFNEGVLVFRTYDRSPEKFVKEGIGFCVYECDKIAGVINSMAIYNGKLKGHIKTLEPYRGRGIATVVAAYLVEYCLENQIEYCWEATNQASVAVAKKLGFVEDGQMTVYQHKEYLAPDELN